MKTFLDCWVEASKALFAQALAGEPRLEHSAEISLSGSVFGFALTLAGDLSGRFAVVIEETVLASPLLGEGTDQKAGWAELLREVADAACGDLLASAGKQCRITQFEPIANGNGFSRGFELKTPQHSWTIAVQDEVCAQGSDCRRMRADDSERAVASAESERSPGFSSGVELLLDVELAASLRFGSREMPLAEILDLGPGDVVQLDRHIADPVDLIVGDKIVAKGDVVLVNGNFALRVTEVAEPRNRLESIRCLF